MGPNARIPLKGGGWGWFQGGRARNGILGVRIRLSKVDRREES